MREKIERVLSDVGRRAGFRDVPAGVVAAAACLAIAAVVWAGWRWWPRSAPPTAGPAEGAVLASASAGEAADPGVAAAGPSAEGTATATGTTLFVHVAGTVRRPGVYELPAGSRVVDALEAAGGPVGDAATDALNLARVLVDGEQILVPTQEQAARQPSITGGAASGTKGAGGGSAPVNINTADAGQLDTLPGVGPSTAAKIIAEREAGGPFSSAEDLSRVSGIGPKRIEQLKGLVSVE